MDERTHLQLDVVVPVCNEEGQLAESVATLSSFLDETMPGRWRITIADNASTDMTPLIGAHLQATMRNVQYLRLETKGRGHALKIAWLLSEAEVLAYVDVDLSTDLRALPPLIAPLLSGHSDIAIGSRLSRGSRVVRGPKRELISRGYNLLLKQAMGVDFSDAQCGFKAIRRDVARTVLPHVVDTGWFFDTEVLVIAERAGLRIHEVPVDWVEDERSSVDIVATAAQDVRGMLRVTRDLAAGRIPIPAIYAELGRKPLRPSAGSSFLGQVLRFLFIGGLSTAAFAILYLLLAQVMAPQIANFLALLTTTIANTSANRRFTFGVRGPENFARHQLQGVAIFVLTWLMTSGALGLLHSFAPQASSSTELVVLTVSNLAATILRFVLLRMWFSHRVSSPAVRPRPDPLVARHR